MTRAAALGFDVGTSAVKAGLLWLESDEPMVVVSRPYPTQRPRAGWVEQDPQEWVSAMAGCWADLQALVGDVELRSVGLCSQANTHLFTDAALAPQRAAITWQDVRAAEVGAELGKDASFSLSRLAWLERHEPALRASTRWLLLPKDFCLAELTGELATDPLSAVGLVGEDGTYLDDVLALVDGAAELLPPLRSFDQPLGLTREANAVGLPSGVPVAVGAMDAWGSFFGAGLVHEGRALDLAGTSEVVGRGLERHHRGAGHRLLPAAGRPAHPRRSHAGRWLGARVGRAPASVGPCRRPWPSLRPLPPTPRPWSSCRIWRASAHPTGTRTLAVCSWASPTTPTPGTSCSRRWKASLTRCACCSRAWGVRRRRPVWTSMAPIRC